jgi:hypothetical protein
LKTKGLEVGSINMGGSINMKGWKLAQLIEKKKAWKLAQLIWVAQLI